MRNSRKSKSFLEKEEKEGTCRFCGRICKNQNSLRNHERLCKNNPEYVVKPKSEKWLGAVKKPRSEEYKAKISAGVRKAIAEGKGYKGDYWRGRKHTEEEKQKISEGVKKWCVEHPEELPYRKYHSSKESYPEQYFRKVLENNSIKFVQEYTVSRYSLDFAFPENKTYFEVDGKQHENMKEHDAIRTKFLEEKGWKLLCRIKWDKYKSLDETAKTAFCKDLINKIMGC